MTELNELRRKPFAWQFAGCFALIVLPACICFAFKAYIGYQVVAFILLLIVSFIAAIFDRWPVFLSAVLSAFIWDFFFIPPYFTITVSSREDFFLLLMYFVIALLNVVITRKIREIDKRKAEKEEQARVIDLYNTLLQTLSHELKTPIATIIGSVDTLTELKDRLTAGQEESLKSTIQLAALRLNDQVEKLLCVSRMEAGALPFVPDWCDINELIHSSLNKSADLLEGRTVVLDLDESLPLVYLDSGLIEIALFNLVQNAHQYTPADKQIYIRTALADGLLLTVADEGPGFPEEHLETIFEKFTRLPHTKAGGTGLGLSIARGFAIAHGGTLTLQNLPGSGAEFRLWIPVKTSYINSLKHE